MSLGAHAHAHAHCKQKSCALRSVAVPRTQARAKLVAEVVRAAWLFCGRYPELHPFSVPPASQEVAGAPVHGSPSRACAELLLTRSTERLGRQLGSRRVEPCPQGEPTRTKAAERACDEGSRVSGQDMMFE